MTNVLVIMYLLCVNQLCIDYNQYIENKLSNVLSAIKRSYNKGMYVSRNSKFYRKKICVMRN